MRTIAILLVLLLAGVSQAQTYQSLSVADLTTVTLRKANSPYYLLDAQVRGTLVIEPGVEVIWATGARMTVYFRGALIASGTAAEPIKFRSLVGTWQGIETVFRSTSKSVLRMSYVDLGHVSGIGNAGLALNNTNIMADNVSILMDAKDSLGRSNVAVRCLSTLISGVRYEAVGELADWFITGPAIGIDNNSGLDLIDITYIGTGNPYVFSRKPVTFSISQ